VLDTDADLYIDDLPGGGERFVGSMDELALWNLALSDEDIALLFAADAAL